MDNPVTYLGLVHIGLMIAFVLSLGGVAWFWLWLFAESMSDSMSNGRSAIGWMIFAHVLPIALFVAWWFT